MLRGRPDSLVEQNLKEEIFNGDIWSTLLPFLSPHILIKVSWVCKLWLDLTAENFCLRLFPLLLMKPPKPWTKEQFEDSCVCLLSLLPSPPLQFMQKLKSKANNIQDGEKKKALIAFLGFDASFFPTTRLISTFTLSEEYLSGLKFLEDFEESKLLLRSGLLEHYFGNIDYGEQLQAIRLYLFSAYTNGKSNADVTITNLYYTIITILTTNASSQYASHFLSDFFGSFQQVDDYRIILFHLFVLQYLFSSKLGSIFISGIEENESFLSFLESLQAHDNIQVYREAHFILETYFDSI